MKQRKESVLVAGVVQEIRWQQLDAATWRTVDTGPTTRPLTLPNKFSEHHLFVPFFFPGKSVCLCGVEDFIWFKNSNSMNLSLTNTANYLLGYVRPAHPWSFQFGLIFYAQNNAYNGCIAKSRHRRRYPSLYFIAKSCLNCIITKRKTGRWNEGNYACLFS